jgi:hypothetical protein
MVEFGMAFIWIMVLIFPAIWLLLGLAYVINKILPMGTPWISDLPMDIATSLLNIMKNCASPKEIQIKELQIAAKSTILVSGIMTVILQWHLLTYSIFWVVLLWVLLSAVEN